MNGTRVPTPIDRGAIRLRHRRALLCLAPLAGLAACAGEPRANGGFHPLAAGGPNVPPFARLQYESLSRRAVVAIALREWRLFGQPIDDDPPDTRPTPAPDDKPERMPGLWQRVGEYWWEALGDESRAGAWTGKHDEVGSTFSASRDGEYAWSAAFVSYVMRVAGAGAAFPYSESHSTYINAAREGGTPLLTAFPLDGYAPRAGDVICLGRGRGERVTFADLPTPGGFPAHCDIVVDARPSRLWVVGGNVDDAVTLKHVPTTPDGKLATPDGTIVDARYHWLTVLRVNYPGEGAGPIS